MAEVKDYNKQFSNIRIIKTPGHSYDRLSLVVAAKQGEIAIVGDVFWKENQPLSDPYVVSMSNLLARRETVKNLTDFTVSRHGDIYNIKNDGSR